MLYYVKSGKYEANSNLSVFAAQGDEWYQHLFHRDATVLEGITVVGYVVVIVVWIGNEVLVHGKDVCRREVGRGQAYATGILDFKDLL